MLVVPLVRPHFEASVDLHSMQECIHAHAVYNFHFHPRMSGKLNNILLCIPSYPADIYDLIDSERHCWGYLIIGAAAVSTHSDIAGLFTWKFLCLLIW